MGVTYTDRYGKVHVGPTGDEYRAAIRRAQEGSGNKDPAPPAEQEDGMHVLQEDVWVQVSPGVSQKLYRHGTKIPDEEAVRLGVLPPPQVKKAPSPENKKRAVSNKTPQKE